MSETPASSLPEWLGDYRVADFMRRGTTAEIFKGFSRDGRPVAIKVLHSELAGDAEATARFRREAETLKKIHHPHVAELLEVGETPERRPYLICELVEGPTLREIIDQRQKSDLLKGLDWMEEAAEALQEAWIHHIIHRDIKPENLMIDEEGQVKLVDFGLSKALYRNPSITQGRPVMGTPRYISPEMILGQSLDLRSDMYSLGATFFHYFTGESPFEAQTHEEMLKRHAGDSPPPPHVIEPSLPEDICYILTRLMAKDPSDRYESYDDLIDHLRKTRLALMSREGVLGSGPLEAEAEKADSPASEGSRDEPAPLLTAADIAAEEARRRRAIEDIVIERPATSRFFSAAVTLFGLGLILGGIYLTYRSSQSDGDGNGMVRRGIDRLFEAFGAPAVSGPDARPWEEQNLELILENSALMEDVMSRILNYRSEVGYLPDSLEEMVSASYITSDETLDAWGTPLSFVPSAGLLYSYGSDGIQFTDDDFKLNLQMRFVAQPRLPVGG